MTSVIEISGTGPFFVGVTGAEHLRLELIKYFNEKHMPELSNMLEPTGNGEFRLVVQRRSAGRPASSDSVAYDRASRRHQVEEIVERFSTRQERLREIFQTVKTLTGKSISTEKTADRLIAQAETYIRIRLEAEDQDDGT